MTAQRGPAAETTLTGEELAGLDAWWRAANYLSAAQIYLPLVLLPRRHPQPCCTRDPRVDQRGRRARLLPGPRLRSGPGQPKPGRVLCRR